MHRTEFDNRTKTLPSPIVPVGPPNKIELNKAKRIKFFRNGDQLYVEKIITISKKRYRTLENLLDDLTRIFATSSATTSAITTIYATNGDVQTSLEDLKNGGTYICACKKEKFVPIKNQNACEPKPSQIQVGKTTPCSNQIATYKVKSKKSIVCKEAPHLIFLIKNGPRPRHISHLFLYKNNNQTFDTVIQAISDVIKLNTGFVQKIFNLEGKPVNELTDFFSSHDIFFVYASAYHKIRNNFVLSPGESRSIKQLQEKLLKIPASCENNNSLQPIASCNIFSVGKYPSIIANNYTIDCFIGKGGFGNVYKILKHSSGMEYALKVANKAKSKNAHLEIDIMRRLNHRNIVKLIDSAEKYNKLFIILEFVRGASLLKIVHKVHVPEEQARLVLKELSEALSYLHSKNIIHRDVKANNILAECDSSSDDIKHIKLTDFGAACKICTSSQQRYYGTPSCAAPEVIKGFSYGAKIDVWAAGLVLFIMLTGKSAFSKKMFQTKEEMFAAIGSGKYTFPKQLEWKVSDSARDLLNNMLKVDQKQRYSSAGVLKHPWIKGNTN
ncbi:serine/threonine-protein kinase GD17699-like [Teleopsis dalmanni]|uniref:serine/threonine-protein kinase GD17699-like n=1 Tax=Teleopsis dalmanni TaxID=139649 RepID=UPI0018CF38F4|nr:serine/threonine-protein kinase GD17699-like [Teleopsis dalmanni]